MRVDSNDLFIFRVIIIIKTWRAVLGWLVNKLDAKLFPLAVAKVVQQPTDECTFARGMRFNKIDGVFNCRANGIRGFRGAKSIFSFCQELSLPLAASANRQKSLAPVPLSVHLFLSPCKSIKLFLFSYFFDKR